MPLILAGATSGSATVQATDAATVTMTLPATSGTLVTTGGAQTIEFADGSASAPSITNSGDTNTGIFFPAADTIAFTEGGVESMRIDSSGNVGILNSAPATALETGTFGTGLAVGSTSATHNITIVSSTSSTLSALKFGDGGSGVYDQGYLIYDHVNNAMLMGTNRAERMRITSGGNFLVNGTTPIGTDGNLLANSDYTATYRSVNNGAAFLHAFASDVSSTRGVVYAIYCNGTAGAVSDQNLKKNIEPARNYLDDLMNIEVVKYNWISDEENAPKELGYIAQQVETVFPGMVDEQTYNDGDGNPVTQKMLKKEVFIPMMLKAIQEQQAIITDLKARIETLENT
jgi:hypothetical protein